MPDHALRFLCCDEQDAGKPEECPEPAQRAALPREGRLPVCRRWPTASISEMSSVLGVVPPSDASVCLGSRGRRVPPDVRSAEPSPARWRQVVLRYRPRLQASPTSSLASTLPFGWIVSCPFARPRPNQTFSGLLPAMPARHVLMPPAGQDAHALQTHPHAYITIAASSPPPGICLRASPSFEQSYPSCTDSCIQSFSVLSLLLLLLCNSTSRCLRK